MNNKIEVFHVVTERPMYLNQIIKFDENSTTGVYKRVMEKESIVKDIYNNKEKYENVELEHHVKVALRELAMEDLRKEKYPNYPSRIKSLYVSRTLEEANFWADYFIKLDRKVYQIVKLEVDGNIFEGDANNCFPGTIDYNKNLELAKDYWENKVNDKKRINEVLVDGTIKVIEIIKEYN